VLCVGMCVFLCMCVCVCACACVWLNAGASVCSMVCWNGASTAVPRSSANTHTHTHTHTCTHTRTHAHANTQYSCFVLAHDGVCVIAGASVCSMVCWEGASAATPHSSATGCGGAFEPRAWPRLLDVRMRVDVQYVVNTVCICVCVCVCV